MMYRFRINDDSGEIHVIPDYLYDKDDNLYANQYNVTIHGDNYWADSAGQYADDLVLRPLEDSPALIQFLNNLGIQNEDIIGANGKLSPIEEAIHKY